MAEYVEVNGVRTWYDERGEGEPLVLLHGGMSDSRVFSGNLDTLAERYRLLLPERRGHGHTPDVPGPITREVMAQDTIAFVEEMVGGPARLAGYSMGAAVALQVALDRPDLVEQLVLISGAFHMDGMIMKPTRGEEPPPAEIVAIYAEVSPDGADHFPVVVEKIVQAVEADPGLTEADLGGIACPTLVMAGDDDIVTLEHTLALYRGIPDAQLAIVPAASHLLLLEKPELCATLVGDFLNAPSAKTMMPIRRVAAV